jgi:ABC-type multidrug transport system ATPase subunit
VGPTGAGKSTLLKALSNRETTDQQLIARGDVFVNSSSLYSEFERLKHQLAVVPQHEILYDALPLYDSLEFTGLLRLPSDLSRSEIRERIDEVLDLVQLSENKSTVIGKLSGGQRKRAALANEILSHPSLLFLDEVTSGLDELTDGEMMSLLRRIADTGKTIVCVTHSLVFVPRNCDLIVALTRFGRLAFVGPPADALGYFGVERLTDIYEKLAVSSPPEADIIHEAFLASDMCERNVHQRLNKLAAGEVTESRSQSAISRKPNLRASTRQWRVLTRRYVRLIASDNNANLMRVIQCLLVAVLLSSVFGDLSQDVIGQHTCVFLVIVSSFWFGCNNAAKELVKERGIYRQERDVSLRIGSYVASKFLLLALIAALQAIGLLLIVRSATGLPGGTLPWVAVVGITAIAGTSFGLVISAWASTEEVAIGAIPIALIPQIILAGSVAPLEGINHAIASIAISSFWGYEAAKETMIMGAETSTEWIKAVAVIGIQSVVAIVLVLLHLHREANRGLDRYSTSGDRIQGRRA